MKPRYSFLVKIWRETRGLESEPEIWRGHVENLQNQNHRYFESFEPMNEFIAVESGTPHKPISGGPKHRKSPFHWLQSRLLRGKESRKMVLPNKDGNER